VRLKLPDTGTITGACHFFVRLKPKQFPNRVGLSRFGALQAAKNRAQIDETDVGKIVDYLAQTY
jgi:hypothetical protein